MSFAYKLIDLTHTLESSIPTWNGDCGFRHDMHIDYKDCTGEDKFRVMKMSMNAGIGTHMDAPNHCIEGGKSINDFKLDDLCMPCIIIDVSSKADETYSVTVEDILDFERSHGTIAAGSCVLIKTGWEKFWTEPHRYHNNHRFPSVSSEAANLLIERGVSALGIDTLSPDRPDKGFKVHQIFLGAGKILIENVANLDNMPLNGAYIMVLPIKIKEGTEAPVRLVGLVKR